MEDMERRGSHIELVDKIASIQIEMARGFAESSAFHQNVDRVVCDLKKDTEQLIHCLYGNGQEGMITKVAKINQKTSIIWGLSWSLGIGLIAILGYFLTHFADKVIT